MLVPSSIASGSDLVQSCRVCTIDHPGMLMALFHYPNQLLESGEKGSWLMPLLELIVTTLQPSLFALGAVYWPFKARFGKAGLPPQPRCLEPARSEPIYGETGSSGRETESEREREREMKRDGVALSLLLSGGERVQNSTIQSRQSELPRYEINPQSTQLTQFTSFVRPGSCPVWLGPVLSQCH